MPAFPDIGKIRYEGPDSKNPLAFRHYNESELVEGKPMRDHLRFSVAYWHTMRGTRRRSVRPGNHAASLGGEGRHRRERHQSHAGRLRVHREARRAVLLLPRPRRRPRRRHAGRNEQEPRRSGQGAEGGAAAHRHQAALGHGQSVQQSALRARRRHELQRRRLRLCRRAGEEGIGSDQGTWRRGLRVLGRPRRLSVPVEHRHEARGRPPGRLHAHGRRLCEEDRLYRPILFRARSPRSPPSTSTTSTARRASTFFAPTAWPIT